MQAFAMDFALGGFSGAIAKTMTAPIERVKLLIQTQDANPLIRSGEVQRYTGIADCFKRVHSEQGMAAFWRGNMTNCIRYFPTQAFNLSFKDTIKKMFPKANPNTEFLKFFAINMASGGLAAAEACALSTHLTMPVLAWHLMWVVARKPLMVWPIALGRPPVDLEESGLFTLDLVSVSWASSHTEDSSSVPLTQLLA